MLTIILSLIFGFIGGMISVFLIKNSGQFISKDEYNNLVNKINDKITELNNNINSALTADYDMLNSINEGIEKTDKFLKDINLDWDKYRRWILGAWNDMYHIKDSIDKEKENINQENDQ